MDRIEFTDAYNRGQRDFSGMDLEGIDLSGKVLVGCNFSGTNFSYSDMSYSKLTSIYGLNAEDLIKLKMSSIKDYELVIIARAMGRE